MGTKRTVLPVKAAAGKTPKSDNFLHPPKRRPSFRGKGGAQTAPAGISRPCLSRFFQSAGIARLCAGPVNPSGPVIHSDRRLRFVLSGGQRKGVSFFNSMILFFVPGEPQGKLRARTVRTARGRSRTYTPEKTVLYEAGIRRCFLEAAGWPKEPVFKKGTAVRIRIEAYYKPPAGTSRRKLVLMQEKSLLPLRKPDIDNVVKAVCDALNGYAYRDDTQVVEIAAAKYYSHENGLRIEIREAGGE